MSMDKPKQKTAHERGVCDPWKCEHPSHYDIYEQRKEERKEAEQEESGCYCTQCLTQCLAVDFGQRGGLCIVCSRNFTKIDNKVLV